MAFEGSESPMPFSRWDRYIPPLHLTGLRSSPAQTCCDYATELIKVRAGVKI